MPKLIIHQDKVTNIEEFLAICPFNALENNHGMTSEARHMNCSIMALMKYLSMIIDS